MMEGQVIVAGPLQGYTDAAWREAHAAAMPGAVDAYFAPFARVEHGAPGAAAGAAGDIPQCGGV